MSEGHWVAVKDSDWQWMTMNDSEGQWVTANDSERSPSLTFSQDLGGIRPGGYLTPLWTTQLVGKSGNIQNFL